MARVTLSASGIATVKRLVVALARSKYTGPQRLAILRAVLVKLAAQQKSISSGSSALGDVEHTVSSIANNPLVQGGLDAVGSAFGDPDLGQQVSQGVAAAETVVNAIVGIAGAAGGAIDSVFGGGISAATIAQNTAIHTNLIAQTGSTAAAAASVQVQQGSRQRNPTYQP